jgi:LysR family glycine cleavage system transcriptional activator
MALLPQFLATDELASGRLVQAVAHTQRNDMAYYIAHAPGAGRTRKVQLFKAWVLAQAELP